MNEFIGNNIKFITEWGQWVAASIFLATIIFLYALVRTRKRQILIVEFFRWFIFSIGLLISISSVLVFARITQIKPGTQQIVGQLESLKGKPHPPLVFKMVSDSTEHNLNEYEGKIVLLNFWATWCGPCVKEMPDLAKLQQQNQDVVVITLSDEKRNRLLSYLSKRPNDTHSVYVDNFDWVDLGSERPASFLIDAHGIVRDIIQDLMISNSSNQRWKA